MCYLCLLLLLVLACPYSWAATSYMQLFVSCRYRTRTNKVPALSVALAFMQCMCVGSADRLVWRVLQLLATAACSSNVFCVVCHCGACTCSLLPQQRHESPARLAHSVWNTCMLRMFFGVM